MGVHKLYSPLEHVQRYIIVTMFYVRLAVTVCLYISVYYADITEQSHNDTTRFDEWNTKILHNMYRLYNIVVNDTVKVAYIIIYTIVTIMYTYSYSVNMMCIV